MMILSNVGWGQTPNGFLNFGTTANGTTATTGNTGFGGVRVGTGGGGFTIMNPGQTIGTDGELRGIAPTGGSINSVGLTSTEFGTASTLFTVSFEVYFSGGSSGTWYFFAGNGASFSSAQSSTFTSAQVFTGIRWAYGASSLITTNNRSAATWNTTGITGTPFAQSTSYFVTIVGNNSASTVNYGASSSVAANKYDLWVNGVLVGDDLAKGELGATTNINAFRFYGESSTGNVATINLDNIRWYNNCVLPPTHLAFANVPGTGTTGTNLSAFTVESRSGSSTGPVSTAYTGAITLSKVTGTGNISGTLSPSSVSGIATFGNIQFDAADTYTMDATAPSPIVKTTSGNVVVSSAGTPTITITSSMTNFGSVTVNTNSSVQSYFVEGTNLTGDITITAPAGFQISTLNSPFTSSSPITLAQVGGLVSSTEIFVRFSPTIVQSYSSNITHTSTNGNNPNVAVLGTGVSPANPTTFTATASSTTQINLSSSANTNGNNIIVVYNGTGTFTSPTDGVAPGNIGDAFAGGNILYKGTAALLTNHSGLSEGQTVFYEAFSFDAFNFYSVGSTANATTLKTVPTTQATNITFSPVGNTSMTINWTNGNGDRRVVIMNTTNSFTNPVDGATIPSTSTVYSGSGEQYIYNSTSNTVSLTGLIAGTVYWFRVYEYNNTGVSTVFNISTATNNPNSQITNTPAAFFEDIETGTKGAYTTGSVICTMGSWTMNEALIGNLANDIKNGAQSVRMRNSGGLLTMNFDLTMGARDVTIKHASYQGDGTSTWKLQKSTDGGTNWIDVGSIVTTSSSTLTTQSFTVNQSGNVRFQIVHITGGSSARLNIDDISITDYDKTVTTTSQLTYTDYGNLTINGLGINVTLNGNTTVNGILTLTNGIINTDASNKLTLETGATISGGSATSFVSGPLAKIINTQTEFTFPVGKGSTYLPIGITPTVPGQSTFESEYFNTKYSDTSTFGGSGLMSVSRYGYHELQRTLGAIPVILTLYWDANSGVTTTTDLRVAHWNTSNLVWENLGINNVTGDTTAGHLQTASSVSSFSPFTIGSVTNQPLPVHLSSLSSSIINRNIKLNWTTASEINNSGFNVERMNVLDNNWSKVTFVSGHGTVNTPTNYSFEDRNLQTGKYKYRLKQIDVNGNFEYFALNGEVEVGVPKKFDLSQNYPNPFNPTTKINFDLPADSKVTMMVYDITGREIARLVNNEYKKAGYYTTEFNAGMLSSGVYFYSLSADNFRMTKKLVVLK
jgi:hypothetical protein